MDSAAGKKPFELLLELESRGRAAMLGRTESSDVDEWTGIAFRLGEDRFAVVRDEIREVRELPPLTRVPGAKPWLLGIANIRGQLTPVADLNAFLTGVTTTPERHSRVLIVNHRDIPAGLLVDEVYGFRRFAVAEYGPLSADVPGNIRSYVRGECSRDAESWPVFDFCDLVESNAFMQVAE